jgi:hypothetical protein
MVDPVPIDPGLVARKQVLSALQWDPDRPAQIGISTRAEGPGNRAGPGSAAHPGRKKGAARGRSGWNRHPAGDDRTPTSRQSSVMPLIPMSRRQVSTSCFCVQPWARFPIALPHLHSVIALSNRAAFYRSPKCSAILITRQDRSFGGLLKTWAFASNRLREGGCCTPPSSSSHSVFDLLLAGEDDWRWLQRARSGS